MIGPKTLPGQLVERFMVSLLCSISRWWFFFPPSLILARQNRLSLDKGVFPVSFLAPPQVFFLFVVPRECCPASSPFVHEGLLLGDPHVGFSPIRVGVA